MKRGILIVLMAALALAPPAVAREKREYIPPVPHPQWFTCEKNAQCIAIPGPCRNWLAVNTGHVGISMRYYKHWVGKVDCEKTSGSKTKRPVKCADKRCAFK